jgi:hypothetical protein
MFVPKFHLHHLLLSKMTSREVDVPYPGVEEPVRLDALRLAKEDHGHALVI